MVTTQYATNANTQKCSHTHGQRVWDAGTVTNKLTQNAVGHDRAPEGVRQ